MSSLTSLKAEAAALEARARASGQSLKHCTALEQVARRHGYGNWRACRAVLSSSPATIPTPPKKPEVPAVAMKHYRSAEWDLSLDIPQHWNKFPAVPSNSQHEIIRFASHENGKHYCIVFRLPHDPKQPQEVFAENARSMASKDGYFNIVTSESRLKSGACLQLDCNTLLEGNLWSVRGYFIFAETLIHMLSFSTDRWDAAQIKLFERIAQSFSFSHEAPA